MHGPGGGPHRGGFGGRGPGPGGPFGRGPGGPDGNFGRPWMGWKPRPPYGRPPFGGRPPRGPYYGGCFPWGCGCCLPIIGAALLVLAGAVLFLFLL